MAGGGGAEVHLAHPHGGGVQHVLRLVDESLHSTEKIVITSVVDPDPGKNHSVSGPAPDPK